MNPMSLQFIESRVVSQVSQAQLGMEWYRFGRSSGKKMGQRSAPARVGIVLGQISQALGIYLSKWCSFGGMGWFILDVR